jgi:nitroimidazol reductase NimA-like FMN-containing flavoprotein (pyridoxamine 5'-phosphate oxidase superfamily)
MTIDPRTWLEILGTDACWELLGRSAVGRLAVVADNRPEIYPVNYALDGRTIVFRTDVGSKLAALDGNPNVCFEIDSVDKPSRSGWSVMVQGQAKAVRDPGELAVLHALPLDFWAVGDKPDFVRIVPTVVSGRRIHPR